MITTPENIIRIILILFLNKWKDESDVKKIAKKFESMFGKELIAYFSEEKYLSDKDRSEYDVLMNNFLGGLKV